MTISLGTTILCNGDSRNATGNPVGPNNLRMRLAPGVAVREFVGADRIQPEHIRCDSGTISFGVTRTYDTEAAALAYASVNFITEAKEGQLKFGSTNVFGAKSVVTDRTLAVVGRYCASNPKLA